MFVEAEGLAIEAGDTGVHKPRGATTSEAKEGIWANWLVWWLTNHHLPDCSSCRRLEDDGDKAS